MIFFILGMKIFTKNNKHSDKIFFKEFILFIQTYSYFELILDPEVLAMFVFRYFLGLIISK